MQNFSYCDDSFLKIILYIICPEMLSSPDIPRHQMGLLSSVVMIRRFQLHTRQSAQ
jgi:hypothetical protein